jgi:membrane-associated phospholipid phosphatase
MIHELQQLDTDIFLKIHVGLSNGFFDWLMPYLRNPKVWIPLYIFIIFISIKTYKKQGYFLIFMLLVTFGIADFTSATLIKKNVKRIRPCNEITLRTQIIHRVPCGSGYSFPSAHATNHFALAIFLIGAFYHRWKPVLPWALFWATSISFAQVYVGVHYPIDVISGALLGTVIGLLVTFIYKKTVHRI